MSNRREIHEDEIRCFNVIRNSYDKRFGLQCKYLLLKKNSLGDAAGEIKCKMCKAKYEIIDNEIILIERGK